MDVARVIVRDLATGRALYTLKDEKRLRPAPKVEGRARPLAAAFSADGKFLLTADGTATVQLWDAATGQWAKELPPPGPAEDHAVTHLATCPGAKRVFVLSGARGYLLDPAAETWGEVMQTTDDLTAVSGDGKTFVTHYSCEAFYTECKVAGDHACTGGAWYAGLSADGTRAACGGTDLALWDTAAGKSLRLDVPEKGLRELARPNMQGFVRIIRFAPDGKTLLAGGDDFDRLLRWDVATGDRLPPLPLGGPPTFFDVTADGKLVVAMVEGVVRRFDAATLKEANPPECFAGHLALALSADGKLAAVGDRAGAVRVFAAPFDKPRVFRASGPAVDALEFSPDGRALYVGGTDYAVGRWDVATGKETLRFKPPVVLPKGWYHAALRLAVSPDGKLVAASADQKAAWVCDAAAGTPLWHRLAAAQGRGDAVTDARPTFAPDGKTLYLGLPRGQMSRHDPATGKEIAPRLRMPGFAPHADLLFDTAKDRSDVHKLALSPDGKQLLVETDYNASRVFLYDLAADRVTWQRDLPSGGTLRHAVFTPAGDAILAAFWDGRLDALDPATGKPIAGYKALPRPPAGPFALAVDGKTMLAPAADGTALVWRLAK